jgi:hypothetical protein
MLPIFTFWGYIILKRRHVGFVGKYEICTATFTRGATAYLKNTRNIYLKNFQSIINHYLPVRLAVEVDVIISHSTIVVDDNIHCSRVINLNFLLVFIVDLVPVKPFKKKNMGDRVVLG